MKYCLLAIALLSVPAFAGSRVTLEHQEDPVHRIQQLRVGDEIGFPLHFELRREHEHSDDLKYELSLGGNDRCEFEADAHGFDKLEIGSHLYWNVASRPYEIHELFKQDKIRMTLVDPRSRREMTMTCNEHVSLDDLRDADFDIPTEHEHPVRVERLSDTVDEAPPANASTAI